MNKKYRDLFVIMLENLSILDNKEKLVKTWKYLHLSVSSQLSIGILLSWRELSFHLLFPQPNPLFFYQSPSMFWLSNSINIKELQKANALGILWSKSVCNQRHYAEKQDLQ